MEPFPFPSVIDNTMRSVFVQCPRKFFYEFIRQKSPESRSVDLGAGAAFAKGLEVARTLFYSGQASAPDAILAGARSLLKAYPDFSVGEMGRNPKTLDRVLGAFGYYFDSWPLEEDYFTPLIQSGKPAVEFSFAIPLPILHPQTGEPILYSGRFDMFAEHRDGGLYVFDDKTTKQLGALWAKKWSLRSQFSGYVWAGQQYGYACGGAVIRGIAIRSTGFDKAEAITARPRHMIDQWHDQLLRDIRRMITSWEAGYFDFDLADACASFSGCGFIDICSSGNPEMWLRDLPDRIWNPLKKPEEEGASA